MQHRGLVSRLHELLALSGALLGGCFYTDSINQRPSIGIRQTNDSEVYRGSTVTLEAESDDPESHVVFYQWRAYACTDAEPLSSGERPGCDPVPFQTAVLDEIQLVVPALRSDGATQVQSLFVILEAQDDYGAIARPNQQLLIPVGNHPPELELSMRTRYDFVVGTPIELYAKYGDPDDGAAILTDGIKNPDAYKLFTPANQPSNELVLIDVDDDPNEPKYLQEGWRFTPEGVGRWEFQLTTTDPLGATTSKSLVIDVVPDHAPCLAQWAPIAAPQGSALPMTDPTLFQVKIVQDDLDPYPLLPGDALLGATAFSWSIKQPGASTRTALGVTGNAASLDPANYAPGDVIELRVEIADRNDTAISCTDASPTCSVISDDACIQRLTWRVEVH